MGSGRGAWILQHDLMTGILTTSPLMLGVFATLAGDLTAGLQKSSCLCAGLAGCTVSVAIAEEPRWQLARSKCVML